MEIDVAKQVHEVLIEPPAGADGQSVAKSGIYSFGGRRYHFPQAGSSDLGRGKYQIGPGIAVSIPVFELNSIVFPTFQQITSVGGDPSRNDVSYTRGARPSILPSLTIKW